MAQDLTKGKPFKTVITYALPVIGGNMFQLFYTLADTIIVGKTLGSEALAAVGATSTTIYFVLCFIQGVTGGFGICLGHRFGMCDKPGMRRSVAAGTVLSAALAVILTLICCVLSHPILYWMQTPANIYDMSYDYMFAVLLGTSATVFYNTISNLLRALGDSRTPLLALIISSLLNIGLDILFIVPFKMGVAGAAWATVLSQLVSTIMSVIIGVKKFDVLRLRRQDFDFRGGVLFAHLKIGLPMGLQMSVMCIGQLAMQGAVNALGDDAIAGYTAATKVDQLAVLVNNAMGVAASNYVAQNFGAAQYARIRSGVGACLIQTSAMNVVMMAIMILCRGFIVPLFVDVPTAIIESYSDMYILAVSPFYLLLGILAVCRSAIQSMNNGLVPFLACIIELGARISATAILSHAIGYTGICLATPLAWIGANALLIPVYIISIRKYCSKKPC